MKRFIHPALALKSRPSPYSSATLLIILRRTTSVVIFIPALRCARTHKMVAVSARGYFDLRRPSRSMWKTPRPAARPGCTLAPAAFVDYFLARPVFCYRPANRMSDPHPTFQRQHLGNGIPGVRMHLPRNMSTPLGECGAAPLILRQAGQRVIVGNDKCLLLCVDALP